MFFIPLSLHLSLLDSFSHLAFFLRLPSFSFFLLISFLNFFSGPFFLHPLVCLFLSHCLISFICSSFLSSIYCVLALFSFLASFLVFLSLMSLVNSRQKEDVRFDPESSIYSICPCWGQFAGHSVFKAGSVSSHLGPVKSIIVHDTATQSRFNLSLFCRAEEAEVGQMLSWFWVSGGDSGCIITAGGSGWRSVVC